MPRGPQAPSKTILSRRTAAALPGRFAGGKMEEGEMLAGLSPAKLERLFVHELIKQTLGEFMPIDLVQRRVQQVHGQALDAVNRLLINFIL